MQLHSSVEDLTSTAESLDTSVPSLLLEQLQYLAAVRTRLSTPRTAGSNSGSGSGLATQFLLLSSTGELMPSSQLHLPPHEKAAVELLGDFTDKAATLHLLHPDLSTFWEDEERRLVLTRLLGVQQADAAVLIRAVAGLYSRCSSGMSEAQRVRHLSFMASHLDALEQDRQLLEQVQQSVRVLTKEGEYCPPGELYFPLEPQYASLEADLCAAGMVLLHSSYLGGSIASSNTTRSSSSSNSSSSPSEDHMPQHRQMRRLLALLGVTDVEPDHAGWFLAHLYPAEGADAAQPAGLTEQQHLVHVAFLQRHWAVLGDEAKTVVKQRLLLLADRPGLGSTMTSSSSASISGGDAGGGRVDDSTHSDSNLPPAAASGRSRFMQPASLYLTLKQCSREEEMQGALRLGGAYFLHPAYSSTKGLEQWVCQALDVQVLTQAAAAEHLLTAHYSCGSEPFPLEQLVQHALYIALDGADDIRQYCRETLLLALAPHPDSHTGHSIITAANAGGELYFPVTEEGWQLQQVLLLGEVQYLHHAYNELVQQLQADPIRRSEAGKLVQFLMNHLGILWLPLPGSAALRRAVAAGNRWRPLLLLLRSFWSSYSNSQQKQLVQQLSGMQVGHWHAYFLNLGLPEGTGPELQLAVHYAPAMTCC